MRILFAGGSEISVASLREIAKEHEIVSVLTHPDRKSGRGRERSVNPVKKAALAVHIPVLEAERLEYAVEDQVRRLGPDLLAAVSYGKIFSPSFLDIFPRGGINMHPSLLPRHRGPSPLQAAIVAGDEKTGITVQRLAPAMDSGAILEQEEVPLTGRETAGELSALAAPRGAGMMVRVLRKMEAGTLREVPQKDEEATYCRLIKQEDGVIDWTLGAGEIDRRVRAYNPRPKASTSFQGTPLYILEAEPAASDGGVTAVSGKVIGVDKGSGILVQTGNGMLIVKKLQLQARKVLDYKDFLNGVHGFIGSVLGAET